MTSVGSGNISYKVTHCRYHLCLYQFSPWREEAEPSLKSFLPWTSLALSSFLRALLLVLKVLSFSSLTIALMRSTKPTTVKEEKGIPKNETDENMKKELNSAWLQDKNGKGSFDERETL